MADVDGNVSGQAASVEMRLRRRRGLLLVVAIGVAILAAVSISLMLNRPSSSSGNLSGPETTDASTVLLGRRYSDKELGLDRLISNEMVPFDAQYRTFTDWEDPYDEQRRYFEQVATGHERERIHFENNLALVFWQADEQHPPDREQLDRAYRSAMDECAASAGFEDVMLYEDPNIDLERYQTDGARLLEERTAKLESYETQFGLDHESYLDLRHDCAKQAAAYPTLDPAVRDELLGRLREHYLAAAYEYLREFPHAEVPLVEHEGSPRPLEDWFISICQKEPEPAMCAAEYRIELPVE